ARIIGGRPRHYELGACDERASRRRDDLCDGDGPVEVAREVGEVAIDHVRRRGDLDVLFVLPWLHPPMLASGAVERNRSATARPGRAVTGLRRPFARAPHWRCPFWCVPANAKQRQKLESRGPEPAPVLARARPAADRGVRTPRCPRICDARRYRREQG